ncbi:MAG: DMT family transporter [Lachnospiraceae bacterium]|nr:DMT family transporter [Lachnospiraceae bacterium]
MLSQRNKGILCILLAAFFFSLMTVGVKMAGDLPTMQKVLFRNLVASVIAWGMLIKSREKIVISKCDLRDLLLRSIFGFSGIILNFYAIDHLALSDANMLNKLSPFFAILMSLVILKEKVSKWEWAAVAIAFAGALLVIKPGFSMAAIPGFAGLMGGFGAGLAYTIVRKMGTRGVKGPVIVMFFSTFSTLASLPFFIAGYKPMSLFQVSMLLMAGIAAAGGQFAITAAYTFAPAKEISIYDYTQILFAAIWGFMLFGQVPDVFSVIGYFVILGAAIIRFVYNKNKV